MKKQWFPFLIGLFLLCGVMAAAFFLLPVPGLSTDMLAVNRIVRHTEDTWERQTFSKPADSPYDYSVIDLSEVVLYQSSPKLPATIHDAVKNRDTVMDIRSGGKIAGKVLISTNYSQFAQQQKRTMALLAFFIFCIPALLSLLCYFYLKKTFFNPFTQLKHFAANIAAGNLELPLKMDRDNVFGPFTESFDLMREQLLDARQKEALANQSKKELTASLSHDIKTPVTSIKLISELLLVTVTEEPVREKISTIYTKAEQIDRLITDMFHAALEDLGELNVCMTEESSLLLYDMFKNADYNNQLTISPIPECIVKTDLLRINQVIDNIINNSYKYAATHIDITASLKGSYLSLEFSDYGLGVTEEELPKLFQKFYRGENTAQQDGSGLGLYIARHLMLQMQGDIQCFNRSDGFSTEILISLA